jgi:phosphohistidine phosphatase
MRHAKSSWDYPDLTDEERPLIEKGIKRTEKTCSFIKAKQLIPEVVYCSPAIRAMETARLVVKQLNMPIQPVFAESFYPGNPEYYFSHIRKVDPNLQHIMIIGHNPGISDFACELLSNQIAEWIPTSGCVVIQLDIRRWDEIVAGKGTLRFYIEPKKL